MYSPPTYSDDDIKIITSEFLHLEKDNDAPDKVKRFRRYANGIILPWKKDVTIKWMPIKEIELKAFMDSFAVHDPKVSHYVSPLLKSYGKVQEDAKRCIILLDFSPTMQKI